MGKKAGWLNAVKKAFSPSKDADKEVKSTKDHVQKTSSKEKKRWSFGKPLHHQGEPLAAHVDMYVDVGTGSEKMASVSEKLSSLVEDEQNSHALAVAAATAAAAEAAVLAAQAAAEVVRLTGGAAAAPPSFFTIRSSREEQAAVKIQAAFRGYLARRACQALKGLMRLQALVRGHTVKRQATVTLRCMQSLVRVQAEVRERRLQKSKEQKRSDEELLWQARHLDSLSKRSLSDASRQDGCDGSVYSADEAHAKFHFKHEATARREQALAYAYSQQLLKSGAITESMLLSGEQGNGHRDWSWLEKWMAGRSWDGHGISKEVVDVSSLQSHEESQPDSSEYTYIRSSKTWKPSDPGLKSPARSLKVTKPLAYMQQPPPPSAYQYSSVATKGQPMQSQNFGLAEEKVGNVLKAGNTASALPAASKGSLKQSTTSLLVHDDDEDHARALPSYMASTKSAKAKSRSQSTPKQRSVMPAKEAMSSSAKKRLSYPPLTSSLNGMSGQLKSLNRQQGGALRSPGGMKGVSGPLSLYHSYNEVSIASLNRQMRRHYK